ncbi:UNVERIFIED_CONTAM: hypothetical protein Slati_2458200 [Sesamum latifolium]|uniref:Reverse transcriptase domain-containing protein n=1 Tax=Sesamum latifolium TaxID=2727402 RepID=A0AAW2WD44_9LAMI
MAVALMHLPRAKERGVVFRDKFSGDSQDVQHSGAEVQSGTPRSPVVPLGVQSVTPSSVPSDGLVSRVPATAPPENGTILLESANLEAVHLRVNANGFQCPQDPPDLVVGGIPMDTEEALVLVPVRFAVGGGSSGRRGRGRKRVARHGMVPQKRDRDPTVVQVEPDVVREGKRRHLMDEESDVLSAETAGSPATRNESPCVELSGVGVPLDSSGISNEKGTEWWRFIGIYGQPDAARRGEAWRLLRILSQFSPRPWLCAGDYNEILSQLEKTGHRYTWSNHHKAPDTMRIRLDRACATVGWRALFPSAQVVTEAARGSDHTPLLIVSEASAGHSRVQHRKMFRFEAMWTRSGDCEAIIQNQWCNPVEGDTSSWVFQHTRQDPISDKNNSCRMALRRELEEFLTREEIMWKQRGKAQWLREGDRNTPYFHARASARRKKNSISKLQNEEGDWCSSLEGIRQIISSYFHTLFQTSNPSAEAIDGILRGMPRKVSNELNETLLQPFSPDEVRHALFQMYPYKSSGRDGMSLVFYQKYWHIVGPKITSFVLEFLNHGRLDSRFNYTYIVLIPKCDSPETMSHLCLISLCNIFYKIASKMLANRLKLSLHSIISESQSAFIPGRLISDNVLVAYELNHYLAHKTWGSVGHATLKLDLSKAYDRVEWSFLESVLAKIGFHPRFIFLIHLCVSTVSYSFLLDEALSHLLSKAEMSGELRGVSISRYGPHVLHLLFADDTLIICQATREAMLCVTRILKEFEEASGLMVNLEKLSLAL